MAKNRYIGEYPVIGIRPIIDGRRGPMQLRESLEDQVMAMAEAAKKTVRGKSLLLQRRAREGRYGRYVHRPRAGIRRLRGEV